jgi:hypothetical protein
MPAFARDVRHALAEVEIVDLQPDQLAVADPGVEQEQENRRVAAVGQVSACRRLQQSAEVVDRNDRHRRVGYPRWPHPLHRGSFDLLLVERPLPELLERPTRPKASSA